MRSFYPCDIPSLYFSALLALLAGKLAVELLAAPADLCINTTYANCPSRSGLFQCNGRLSCLTCLIVTMQILLKCDPDFESRDALALLWT